MALAADGEDPEIDGKDPEIDGKDPEIDGKYPDLDYIWCIWCSHFYCEVSSGTKNNIHWDYGLSGHPRCLYLFLYLSL